MEVKKIVDGMTAPQVAQVIDDNFKAQNAILEEDIAKQNNVIGVSEYKDFSEAEAVNVGDVRKYEGFLYECVEATTGAFDASKWKKSSFKAETEKKLSELESEVSNDIKALERNVVTSREIKEGKNVDFGISDEDGNVIVEFKDGHVKTKNFDSEDIKVFESEVTHDIRGIKKNATISSDVRGNKDSDLGISDEDGNVIVEFKDGHVKTKNFDSAYTSQLKNDTTKADFSISDEDGNVLAEFKDGHIKTKKFNSSNVVTSLTGKIMSIIGDSISTFAGWLPSSRENYDGATYEAYYPYGDVDSVDKTWWYQVAEKLSLTIGQNCAWSGSRVAGDGTSKTSAFTGCSDRRIADLALGGVPDIIVVYIGINDLANNNPVGTITSKDKWLSNGVTSTFADGYSLMLSKILKTYPLAQIFCCSLFPSSYESRDDDNIYPTKNPFGIYLEDYNAKIKELSVNYGAHFIDLQTCGIHWGNLSLTMADGKTHPNALGQRLMANMIKNELLKSF